MRAKRFIYLSVLLITTAALNARAAEVNTRKLASLHEQAARLELSLGQLDPALSDLELVPHDQLEALPLRVEALDRTGKGAEALRLLGSLRPSTKTTAVRLLEAQLLIASGRSDEGVRILNVILASPHLDGPWLFTAGSSLLQAGHIEQARGALERFRRLAPGPATDLLVGRVYRDAGQVADARRMLHSAIKSDPRTLRVHYYLGTLDIMREGDMNLPDAEQEFRDELVINPDDLLANLNLGIVLLQEHRATDAIVPLSVAARLPGGAVPANTSLAQAYVETEQYAAAEEAGEAALLGAQSPDPGAMDALSPRQQAQLQYALAQAYRHLGKTALAGEAFRKAREFQSESFRQSQSDLTRYLDRATSRSSLHPSLLQWPGSGGVDPAATERKLAVIRSQIEQSVVESVARDVADGNTSDALMLITDQEKASPDSVALARLHGSVLLEDGKPREAVEPLRKAFGAHPEDQDTQRLLGRAYFESNDLAKAVDTLETGTWKDIPTQYAFAVSLARLGRTTEAQQAFSKLITEHPDSADLQVLLGKANVSAGRTEVAQQQFQKALLLDPMVPEAHFQLGMLALKGGELATGAAEFAQEMKLHPGFVPAQLYAAFTLGLQQRHEEAVAILRKLAHDHPGYPDTYSVLGKELLALNRLSEAVAALQHASQLDPANSSIDYQLGLAYRKLGQTAQANAALASMREKQQTRRDKDALPVTP